MAPAATTTEELTQLHADLGEAFADVAAGAVRNCPRRTRPELIGVAGQTVCHLPGRRGRRTVTLQLGEAARVAVRTGLPVVADFRQSDVAVGGQGAPLVPWTDWILFRSNTIGRAVQNIGGVANVTWLPPGGGPGDIVAFDTGPGNMLIDALSEEVSGGRRCMDRGGRQAARGRVLEAVLTRWMDHPYLRAKPPKTTGREAFGRPFLEAERGRLTRASSDPDDWLATATAFTARTIAMGYRRWLRSMWSLLQSNGAPRGIGGRAVEVIVCGGGSANPTLMTMLAAELGGASIRRIDTLGMPSAAKEAVSFALLAAACEDRVPGNVPQATGAARPVVLGRIVRPSTRGEAMK